MTLHVRTAVEPASLAGWIRREVQALEPHLPLGQVQPMAQTVGSSLYLAHAGALLISGLGTVALTLASIGLYGVLAFAVSRRTREIGIRTALGARSTTVFSMVVTEGMALAALGIILGVLLARSASGVIGQFLVGVQPTDAVTYAGVACLLAIVAAVACAVPAWRASKVDPLMALRLP